MLSTEELKKYIYNEIRARLGNLSYGNLFFAEGTDHSAEGTYMFNKENAYHILYTEKGEIRSDIVTDDKREVLWHALETLSADIIINFALGNREKGKDFRRAYFAKEREIFALIGKDFKERKENEIRDILTRYPYDDV